MAVGDSIALTQEDRILSASIPDIQPSASPQISLDPPAPAQTSAASEQLSAPSASSHAPSSSLPLPSSSIPPEPTPTAQTHTHESQLGVPSEAPSRQGTPIASSFSPGSWQEADPTQVASVSPSAPVPDTQATIVDSHDKEASVEYVTDKESALAEKEASHVAVIECPTLPDISQAEAIPSLPLSGSQITPSIPFDILSLPPLPVPQPAQPAAVTTNGEDAEAQGEDHYADDGETAAEDAMEVENEAPQPAKKKRGRPAGSKTAKKTQAKRKAPVKKGTATATEAVVAEEEEEEGQSSTPAVEGEGDIEVPAESAAPTKKRKTYTKRKTPAKKAKKSKKNSAGRGDGAAEDGAEEDEDDEEEVEPWNIAKTRPGYSLATSDIYAAIGIAPPTSFQFTTAQDLAEMPHEEEEEEEQEQDNDERQGDESMRNEYDDDQYDEDGEYDDQDRQDHGTTPWHPLKRAIDPTITTMRQLTEDTGRGRITPSLHKDMIDKIDRKQKLKLARETMKLRQSLKKAGLKGEAVERTLKIKIEEIMQGGILEFDERLDWSNNASQEENGYSINSNTLVRFANGDADAAEESGHGTNAHAGPSSEAYNNEEDTQSQHHDQREGTEGAEEEDGFEGMAESHYGPQVRVVDGELVVDEASTQIVRVSLPFLSPISFRPLAI